MRMASLKPYWYEPTVRTGVAVKIGVDVQAGVGGKVSVVVTVGGTSFVGAGVFEAVVDSTGVSVTW
jgi:hypothetical protein